MILASMLQHWLGIDNSNSAVYLFFSGSGGFVLAIGSGVYGYFKLKSQHRKHVGSIHHHIDQTFAKLTDEKAN